MAHIRLLQRKPDGEIVFREPTTHNVPAYAILSHTWGKEEVSFCDMEANADRSKSMKKAGWKKIQFCAEQAAADGLQYFWVDTCCIDKKNAVELGAAINSMFRWYQNAARCYVYLSDVSTSKPEVDDERAREEAFRKSRWFTRGWILQELIAPRLVDFFSSEGERLGSKLSLESKIHEITDIAKNALQGNELSNFSIKERRSWAERRDTTVEEDTAYCLIGIFEVSMVPNYGEGLGHAFRRLDEEIQRMYKGVDFEEFAVGLDLASFPEPAQFVAREKELSSMHELLHDHTDRACVVLHGLGGMGKTQLAITYTRRHKEKYTAIFWLNANDEDSLKLSFRDIAQQVLRYQPSTSLLANVNLDNPDQTVHAVKVWLDLQKNTRWLMIYDNYDNPKIGGNPDTSSVDIRRFLPRSDQGSVIITTRSSQVSHGHRIHIQKLLDVIECLEILSNTSRRKDIAEDPDAEELIKELDGLPLALATAGAYLEQVSITLTDYLRLYNDSWLKLQTTSPKLASYEDRALYTTWQITFDRIQQQNPLSASLLKLWAYFDRQDIWFELFEDASYSDNRTIQELTKDELSFNKAISLLCSFGLVDPHRPFEQQSGSGGYSVHSCVHSWSIFVLNKEWDKNLARLALRCVASKVVGEEEVNHWIINRRLFQHAIRQYRAIIEDEVNIVEMEGELHNLGLLYDVQGKLVEAEWVYQRALQGQEKLLGAEHISTLNTVHGLGLIYQKQGRLIEAGQMYQRALQGFEKAWGSEHTSVFQTINNLGVLYRKQGRLIEAEQMLQQALQGYKEAWGSEHTSVFDTINNLGILYKKQGKLVEAEQMFQHALQGLEKVSGPKHTSTLITAHNLGLNYFKQGQLVEAEQMLQRALQGYEDILGSQLVKSHLPALYNMWAFGDLFRQTGRKDEAKEMYTRALAGYTVVRGPSSEECKLLEDQLQALQAPSTELEVSQKELTELVAQESRGLKRKYPASLESR